MDVTARGNFHDESSVLIRIVRLDALVVALERAGQCAVESRGMRQAAPAIRTIGSGPACVGPDVISLHHLANASAGEHLTTLRPNGRPRVGRRNRRTRTLLLAQKELLVPHHHPGVGLRRQDLHHHVSQPARFVACDGRLPVEGAVFIDVLFGYRRASRPCRLPPRFLLRGVRKGGNLGLGSGVPHTPRRRIAVHVRVVRPHR
jgi:hypothetical protein